MAEVGNRIFADAQGHPLFRCRACGAPITESDFGDLGFRVPEHGETRDEYCDAELIDDIVHKRCIGARSAGPS